MVLSTHVDVHAPLADDIAVIAERVAAELYFPEGIVGIAYSGGVDSATLAALAARFLGADRTVLLMAVSPSLAKRERIAAQRQAELLGLRLVEIETREFQNPNYVANPVDRCYHCKDEMFTRFEAEALDALGLVAVAHGENADDMLRPDRPGAQAAEDHHVLRPLAAAGATKEDIRRIALAMGIPSATKPAAPCLASRIPHGEEVTAEKLAQIDAAEDAVFDAGFSDCRVRHHGDMARIEVPEDEFHLIADDARRHALLVAVRKAGFQRATLDLAGIQSGAFTMQILSRRPSE